MTGKEMELRSHGGSEGRQEFLVHLMAYVLVGVLLVFISRETSPDYFWAKWPLLGWGIGLLLHAVRTFVLPK